MIKVGDTVTRMWNFDPPQEVGPLKVTAIDQLIHCGPWTFHKETGFEVDPDMGWDGITKSGSYLKELR